MRKPMMAIDPGLQGTGYAIWHRDPRVPDEAGVLRGPRGPDWMARVDHIAVNISELVRNYEVRHIICEQMEHFGTAQSSMSWKTGDLQRTVFLIGTIHGMTRLRCRFELVTPREWKGQLPKSVTIARVRRALGRDTCRGLCIETHAWDAVGIGLWKKGVIQ